MKRTILFFLILCQAVWCYADDSAMQSGSDGPEKSLNQEISETDSAMAYQNIDALFTLYQPYLDNISAYRPIYFLAGTDPRDSTFQFSFKYRLFDIESEKSKKIGFLNGFHFAYTQTSFWDLAADSLPFEDTSYKPELFFAFPKLGTGFSANQSLYFQTGIQHESNGQGGDISRSTNFLYAQPIFIDFNPRTTFGFLVAPKVWTYVENDDESNQDLPDYRGYFELEVICGLAESLVVGSNLCWAKEGGSIQLDVTFPIHRIIKGISGAYLQVQYVNALAESLINYDERTEAVRIGLSIIR
jgi:outer membrane phospholipase A